MRDIGRVLGMKETPKSIDQKKNFFSLLADLVKTQKTVLVEPSNHLDMDSIDALSKEDCCPRQSIFSISISSSRFEWGNTNLVCSIMLQCAVASYTSFWALCAASLS